MRYRREKREGIVVTCADCGEIQALPLLPPGGIAACHRCDRVLDRRLRTGSDVTLASAIAVFLLLPPAVFLPLMHSTIQNLLYEQSRLVSSVPVIYSEVWFPFAFGFFFFAFLFPALRALFQILVLGSIRLKWKIWQRGRMFRWSEELRIWSMTDVVVIAGLVAYFRASIPADVDLLMGAWCYLAVAFFALIGDKTLDRRGVWNEIFPDRPSWSGERVVSCGVCELVASRRKGDPCPRCGAVLDPNIAIRFAPALALVAASIPLCIPAYAAAVMVNDQLTGVLEHTVIGTVQLLADRGYWQFGVVVLFGGVVIPILVLIGLVWVFARVRFPSSRGLVIRTRVFRILRRLVRWPMIIPFIAAIAAPIVDFRGIDDIVAGPGATPLFLMIAFLMLAVRLFQPRLMWKSAGEMA